MHHKTLVILAAGIGSRFGGGVKQETLIEGYAKREITMENTMKYIMKGPRKYWIDALRGLAMVLVIFGHNRGSFTEYYVVQSVHETGR